MFVVERPFMYGVEYKVTRTITHLLHNLAEKHFVIEVETMHSGRVER